MDLLNILFIVSTLVTKTGAIECLQCAWYEGLQKEYKYFIISRLSWYPVPCPDNGVLNELSDW